MPLLCNSDNGVVQSKPATTPTPSDGPPNIRPLHPQAQHSGIAKTAIMSNLTNPSGESAKALEDKDRKRRRSNDSEVENGRLLRALTDAKENPHSRGKALTVS